jgi:hypothetical protein
MNQNEKMAKLQEAVETADPRRAGRLIVELLLDADESVADIAADFIENEVGRFDWVNNWQVVRSKGDPLGKVQAYLDQYGLVADAQAVVDAIDQLAAENPGRWK